MRKFQCFLFELKGSYICRHIICMTVPLKSTVTKKVIVCFYNLGEDDY